ncbi:MAG: hypothetical protein AB7G11_07500 [Phycisphaerales bacterium]
MQAELLALYDPHRSSVVRRRGVSSDWDALARELNSQIASLRDRRGEGLHVVLPPTTSPTAAGLIARARERFPRSSWYRHDPLDLDGRVGPDRVIDLSRARAIVSLDADLFGPDPAGVRLAHDFAQARRESRDRASAGPGLFVAEAVPTPTGARADWRLALRPGEMQTLAAAMASLAGADTITPAISDEAQAWLGRVEPALRSAGAGAVVVAGEHQPPWVHSLCLAANLALGSVGTSVTYIEPVEAFRQFAHPLAELRQAIDAGAGDWIILVDVNPAYDAIERDALIAGIRRARFSVHLGLHVDETAQVCEWHAPLTHDLERGGCTGCG